MFNRQAAHILVNGARSLAPHMHVCGRWHLSQQCPLTGLHLLLLSQDCRQFLKDKYGKEICCGQHSAEPCTYLGLSAVQDGPIMVESECMQETVSQLCILEIEQIAIGRQQVLNSFGPAPLGWCVFSTPSMHDLTLATSFPYMSVDLSYLVER